MALNNHLMAITREANADLSAGQYKFVELDTNGRVGIINSAGELAMGVLQNDPDASGRAAEVGFAGVSKVVLGATVAVNAKVTSDNVGRAVTAASTNHVQGICIKGGAVGEIGEILLLPVPVLA